MQDVQEWKDGEAEASDEAQQEEDSDALQWFHAEANELTKRIPRSVEQQKSAREILGVLAHDGHHEIRSAYRRLLMYVHPQHSKGSDARKAYNGKVKPHGSLGRTD